jgi:hypothetical protein
MAYSANLFHYSCQTLFFLKSYLEGHIFNVHLNDSTSTPKLTPSGLIQDAVLMTTLFSLYLSDKPCPPHTHPTLYADDTALLSQSWRPDTISCRLSNPVMTLLKYCNMWKLWLNTHETETILFSKCHPPSWTLFKSRTPLCPGPRLSTI